MCKDSKRDPSTGFVSPYSDKPTCTAHLAHPIAMSLRLGEDSIQYRKCLLLIQTEYRLHHRPSPILIFTGLIAKHPAAYRRKAQPPKKTTSTGFHHLFKTLLLEFNALRPQSINIAHYESSQFSCHQLTFQ